MERLVVTLKFAAGLLLLFAGMYLAAGVTLVITWSRAAAETAAAAVIVGGLAGYFVCKAMYKKVEAETFEVRSV